MAKSMLRMGRCVRFCWQHFIPSHKERQGFPLLSVLDFRCFRVIALANHKRTFDERIGCITRHDDFVPRSHRAVFTASLSFPQRLKKTEAVAVEPVKQKTSEFIWFKFTRPLRACVYDSIRQRFRTVLATGYWSVQERAWPLSQIMYSWWQNTMETTTGRIFIR